LRGQKSLYPAYRSRFGKATALTQSYFMTEFFKETIHNSYKDRNYAGPLFCGCYYIVRS